MTAFPPRGIEIIDQIRATFPDLAKLRDEESRRKLTRLIVEQMCYELGPAWGTKARDARSPQSKDSIAYKRQDGSMDIWDWQNGETRDRQIKWGDPPSYANVSDAYFIEVQPINHLYVAPIPITLRLLNTDEMIVVIDEKIERLDEKLTDLEKSIATLESFTSITLQELSVALQDIRTAQDRMLESTGFLKLTLRPRETKK